MSSANGCFVVCHIESLSRSAAGGRKKRPFEMVFSRLGCHAYAGVSMSYRSNHACLRERRHVFSLSLQMRWVPPPNLFGSPHAMLRVWEPFDGARSVGHDRPKAHGQTSLPMPPGVTSSRLNTYERRHGTQPSSFLGATRGRDIWQRIWRVSYSRPDPSTSLGMTMKERTTG